MAALRFHKVTSLPGTLEADAVYFVQSGTVAETYVTNSAGVARSVGNTAMISSVANSLISSALADMDVLQIVADITARNALSLTRNAMALVIDATGDATVTAGAALYAYRESNTSWIKITEYEALSENITLAWSAITGKPASAVSLIDDAVTKRHTHANLTFLNKIGESAGALTYDGASVGASWNTTNW
jgi:hypothetical protein